jgi:hypothetical protein
MSKNWWDELEHERRFILDRGQTEVFLAATADHLQLAEHHNQSPVAYTRTTYLDTDEMEYLSSCTDDAAGRGAIARRLRIREYAAAADTEASPILTGICFIELKESMGSMRKKRRFAAPRGVLANMVRCRGELEPGWAEPGAVAHSLVEIQRRLGRARLRSCLQTWYRRWSFRAKTEAIRVTLDEGLAFSRPPGVAKMCASGPQSLSGQSAQPKQVASYGPGRVLEIKLKGRAPAWLVAAMDELPEAPEFSKFQTGMEVLMRCDLPVRTAATRPMTIPRRMAPQST